LRAEREGAPREGDRTEKKQFILTEYKNREGERARECIQRKKNREVCQREIQEKKKRKRERVIAERERVIAERGTESIREQWNR
jgi:hypothetical protein